MQKLIWTNANGDSVDLTSGHYGITNWEGFSNTSLNIRTQQVPFQDGGVFLDALMEQRELTVTLAMNDKGNLETRYRLRRELIHILNPKLGEGYLIYRNDFTSKRIKCIPQIPLFENHNSNDSGTPKVSLAWTACNPYWEDVEETVVELTPNQFLSVENSGDIPTQLEIELRGNIVNPILVNSTTEKRIAYLGNVSGGLKISTLMGQKYVNKGSLGFTLNCGGAINGVATNGIVTVYVGDNIIVEDINGTKTPVSNPSKSICNSIAYGNGVFVIATTVGYLYSETGYEWTVADTSILASSVVKYANGVFMASCGYSYDGINWNLHQNNRYLGSIFAYGNGMWVYKGDNYFYYSYDGLTWTQGYHYTYGGNLTYGDRFIFVRYNEVLTSDDGINWEVHTKTTVTNISFSSEIVYYKNKYYSIGSVQSVSTGVLLSEDGIEWTYTQLLELGFHNNNEIHLFEIKNLLYYCDILGSCYSINEELSVTAIINGTMSRASKIIKIDDTYYLLGTNILKSTDLINWENLFSYDLAFHTLITDMIIVNDVIIFCSDNNLYESSEDGLTYHQIYATVGDIRYLSYVNNKYLVITSTGNIYTSTDLENWDVVENNLNINSVCYAQGVYVGLGTTKIYTTTDLQTWTERFTISSGDIYYSVVNANRIFFAVGNNGRILISYDSITWTTLNLGITDDLYSVTYGNGTYIFCGRNGALYETNDLVDVVDRCVVTYPYFYFTFFDSGNFYIISNDGCVFSSNYQTEENAIENLSSDSDMRLNFIIGSNYIGFANQNVEATAYIKYRQKYIGV